MSDWQPIETMPDGEFGLVFGPGQADIKMAWMRNLNLLDVVIYDHRKSERFDTNIYLGLTHWMPLPEPPK